MMIYRNVLFKLSAAADDAVIQKILLYVDRIRDEIPETREYRFAPNKAEKPDGFNWVLLATFDNEEDMNAYRINPLHLEFVAFCDAYTNDFIVCFYEGATT